MCKLGRVNCSFLTRSAFYTSVTKIQLRDKRVFLILIDIRLYSLLLSSGIWTLKSCIKGWRAFKNPHCNPPKSSSILPILAFFCIHLVIKAFLRCFKWLFSVWWPALSYWHDDVVKESLKRFFNRDLSDSDENVLQTSLFLLDIAFIFSLKIGTFLLVLQGN